MLEVLHLALVPFGSTAPIYKADAEYRLTF
jgi:hypothetical protein